MTTELEYIIRERDEIIADYRGQIDALTHKNAELLGALKAMCHGLLTQDDWGKARAAIEKAEGKP